MAAPPPVAVDVGRLLNLLRDDDLDGAIDAGLMACDPDGIGDELDRSLLVESQDKLRTAWAARKRYQARNERLARQEAERQARRAAASCNRAAASALPPAAAAALARAMAKASRKP